MGTMDGGRPATVADVHAIAAAMPHVSTNDDATTYSVGAKPFVFFRTPRADAVDPETGERYTDLIGFWVPSEADKRALVQDPTTPFFTTAHFDDHPSVLIRERWLADITLGLLTEVIQDAWLAQASRRRATAWLADAGLRDA